METNNYFQSEYYFIKFSSFSHISVQDLSCRVITAFGSGGFGGGFTGGSSLQLLNANETNKITKIFFSF
jgi:hypothetical protein